MKEGMQNRDLCWKDICFIKMFASVRWENMMGKRKGNKKKLQETERENLCVCVCVAQGYDWHSKKCHDPGGPRPSL